MSAYVAEFFWLAFVWGAIKAISLPETGRHSHLRGWSLLIVATAIMITTIRHWVKYLSVVLGGGVLGGLLAIAEGHLINGTPFPRPIAFGMTMLLVGCGLISQSLAKRSLSVFDRVALVGFVAGFVGGMVIDTPVSGLVGLSVGFGFLITAWMRHKLFLTTVLEVRNDPYSADV